MKKIVLLFVLFTCIDVFSQIDQNAIKVESSGSIYSRRYSSQDYDWKKAFTTELHSTGYRLNINFDNDYAGVRINGLTTFDEVNVYSQYNQAYRIGFDTDNVFLFNNSSIAHNGLTKSPGNNIGLSGYNSLEFFTNSSLRIKVLNNGNVGIGTSLPDEKLTVNGKIHAKEIKVDIDILPDYVFQKYFTGASELKPDYERISLSELEEYIRAEHHLPDVPSSDQIKENGLELGEMNNLLLQKIEELTLYILEQNKRIEHLENKMEEITK